MLPVKKITPTIMKRSQIKSSDAPNILANLDVEGEKDIRAMVRWVTKPGPTSLPQSRSVILTFQTSIYS